MIDEHERQGMMNIVVCGGGGCFCWCLVRYLFIYSFFVINNYKMDGCVLVYIIPWFFFYFFLFLLSPPRGGVIGFPLEFVPYTYRRLSAGFNI